MLRIRNLVSTLLLALSVSFAAVSPILLPVGIVGFTVSQTSCGPDTLEKLNTTLNQVAHSLEAAVDTNGKLYAAGTYGTVGSDGAIAIRVTVATVIHSSNEYLIQALDVAKTLTKQTFEGRKIEVLQKLSLAATGLSVGHKTIDLVLQTVATLINQAVALVQLFHASDTQYMHRIVPTLDKHLKAFGQIREVTA